MTSNGIRIFSQSFLCLNSYDYLIKEIEVGIDDSDVKAGHIKAGIRVGTDEELKFFKTTAEVSREKNLLVTAHTSRGTHPANCRKMLYLLLDSGINPDKLLLCHIHFIPVLDLPATNSV